jgi:hypothetical protein
MHSPEWCTRQLISEVNFSELYVTKHDIYISFSTVQSCLLYLKLNF